jgi:acetyl-CoA acetyltransferase
LPLKNTSIVSGAQTKFGNLEGVTIREMFAEAVDKATVDAGIPKKEIQAAFIGAFIPEMLVHQGQREFLQQDTKLHVRQVLPLFVQVLWLLNLDFMIQCL